MELVHGSSCRFFCALLPSAHWTSLVLSQERACAHAYGLALACRRLAPRVGGYRGGRAALAAIATERFSPASIRYPRRRVRRSWQYVRYRGAAARRATEDASCSRRQHRRGGVRSAGVLAADGLGSRRSVCLAFRLPPCSPAPNRAAHRSHAFWHGRRGSARAPFSQFSGSPSRRRHARTIVRCNRRGKPADRITPVPCLCWANAAPPQGSQGETNS